MKRDHINILLAVMLLLMAASARILNREMHLFNFAPLVAIGLFSGAVIKDRRLAFLVPLLGQLVADVYFQLFTNTPGFYGVSQVFTYLGLLTAAYIGILMTKPKALTVLAYTFCASTLFFIISNFGVYLQGWYGRDLNALATTYIQAIPFFKYTIAGDMAGSVLLFGGYFLVQMSLLGKMRKAKS